MKKTNIAKDLENWFAKARKVVIAGIGNPICCDDFAGTKIVQNLQDRVSDNVYLLECETVPEKYLLDIEEFKPTHVLLVDVAFLGLNPGETRLVDSEKIKDFTTITTHLLPLHIFCDYIKQATGAKINLLLIEPKCIEFGEGLTSEVQTSVEKITKLLQKLLS
jgi:hydrogenase 3 maturation protease